MIALVLAAALGGATVASADSRCNDLHINEIQGELQNFAQHPAGASKITERSIAIVQAQTDAQQERVILQGVCSEGDFVPLGARLFALDAWADLLSERNGEGSSPDLCPGTDKKVMAGAAASAWLKLALAAAAPKPPALVATLVPQVQAMATQAGLTLPTFSETSAYWEQKYEAAAKQAIIDCASQMSPPPRE
ncbi:MAG TPA: hypothetical protein VMA98_03790 [Candidatus Acidoferrales bacterium]|nr:hypothetical protein [Candidatus Acidoferrales bacterium]